MAPSSLAAGRLALTRAGLIVVVLVAELVALAATGSSTSPLAPLLMVPPLLGALTRSSTSEALLWFGGTFAVVVLAAAWELTQPPGAAAPLALATTTALAVLLGYSGAAHLRRRLAQAQARAHEANVEAIAAVGSLHQHQLATAASFAHELKNPLAAMQGLATLVRRRGTREPELAAELDAIVADVHRMSAAVSELLDFSRAIHPESLERVALRPLITRLASAPIDLRVPDDLSLVAEPRKLERVLRALLALGAVGVDGSTVGAEVHLEVVLARAPSDTNALALASALAAQKGGRIAARGASFTLCRPRHEAT